MSEDTRQPGGNDRGNRSEGGWATTRVAAKALEVKPRQVRNYITEGELEYRTEGNGVNKTYLVSVHSVNELRACLVSNRVGLGGAKSASFTCGTASYELFLRGSFLSFRSVSTKVSYQRGPPSAPERHKRLTLTLTKQALSSWQPSLWWVRPGS